MVDGRVLLVGELGRRAGDRGGGVFDLSFRIGCSFVVFDGLVLFAFPDFGLRDLFFGFGFGGEYTGRYGLLVEYF